MKTRINTLKTDLYHVLVEGRSNSVEKARVFLLFFIPLMTAFYFIGGFPY